MRHFVYKVSIFHALFVNTYSRVRDNIIGVNPNTLYFYYTPNNKYTFSKRAATGAVLFSLSQKRRSKNM